jgi:hypothetical protein
MTDQPSLRQRVARAIHRYDNHHALSGNDIPSKHHYGEADFVLAELRTELEAASAVVPAADRAAVRAEAFDEAAEKLAALPREKAALAGESAWKDAAGIVRHMAVQERRMTNGEESAAVDRVAAETPPAETECAHCGKPVQLITGTLTAWWVHDPGGNTVCHPQQAASSPRAEPGPAVEAQPGKDTETPHPKEA